MRSCCGGNIWHSVKACGEAGSGVTFATIKKNEVEVSQNEYELGNKVFPAFVGRCDNCGAPLYADSVRYEATIGRQTLELCESCCKKV